MTVLAKMRKIAGVIRLRAYDTSTDQGRADERYRRAALMALTGTASRLATIVAAIVVVPLCVGYLGKERYGMWLAISSLFSFSYVADLGITAGLQLSISRCDSRDDREGARKYVSSAFAILVATTTIGALILVGLYLFVDWAAVFNVHTQQAIAEAAPATVAFGVTWLVNILTAVVLRVSYGYQEGYIINAWQVFGAALSITAVVVATRVAHLGLPAVILASVAVPALAQVLAGIQLFRRRPWLRPSLAYVDRAATRQLLRDGGWYLLAGLGYNTVFLSGDMLIAQMLGAEVVAEFGVPFRVSAVLTLVTAAIVNAFMPAYTEAITRGDRAWVRRALGRSLAIAGAIGGVGALGFIAFGRPVISAWVSGQVQPGYIMLGGLGLYAFILGISNGINSFVQGTGGVRANGLQWLMAALLAVPAQFAFIRWLGAAGVPWGLVVVELLCRVMPGVLYYRAWMLETWAVRA